MTRSNQRSPLAAAVSTLLFAVGSGLCVSFLSRMFSWEAVAIVVALLLGLRWWAERDGPRGVQAVGTWLARAFVLSFNLLALYMAIAWGGSLIWAVSLGIKLGVGALLAVWLLGRFAPRTLPRVPLVLPLGIWIASCLLGWLREESFIRCDDLSRLRAPATLLMPTTTEVSQCQSGHVIPIGRYPRKFWQSRDGRWLRFTTQRNYESAHPPGRLSGLACELDLTDANAVPRCVGNVDGKSHGIVGVDALDQVFFAAWSLPRDDQGRGSAIFTLPPTGPIAIAAEHRFDGTVGDMIIEPRSGILHAFCDSNDRIRTVILPDFVRQPDTEIALFPGQVRYDQSRDEGVVCSWLTGAAVRANPLSVRFFGAQAPTPWSVLALSWGCDWDPITRRVYTAVPNLGLLYEIDFDSGEILHKHWVGFGMRSATLDRARRVVYLTHFLGGDVVAVDIATGTERDRWFAGRFVREAYLARDGGSLFVSSNLGVVRIALAPQRNGQR